MLQADDEHYIPRAILLDLEPRVLETIKTGPLHGLYNPENIWMPGTGGGAGNNWAVGYERANENVEEILVSSSDLVTRDLRQVKALDCRR